MFVADALMDGIETFPDIVALLNDRRLGGWRNAVYRDFTTEDVFAALDELISSGLIDMWSEDISGLIPITGEAANIAELVAAKEGSRSVWFRLTVKGRQTVEYWNPPETFDQLLTGYLERSPASPTSLYSAYQWLSEQLGQHLTFSEFARLIDYMLEYNYLHLWRSDGGNHDQGDRVFVPMLPSNLDAGHKVSEHADFRADPRSYFLTLGEEPALPLKQEHLADILDPSELVEKLIERDPDKRAWFTERKAVRHVVVDDKDTVTIGIGSVSEFRAKIRWGKGLPEMGNQKIRHIILDETGKVISDYHGPAASDPLDTV